MTQQNLGANKFTLADDSGSTQIIYYPHAPGPILVGQGAGPRLEYQGAEGNFIYPHAGPGRENIDLQSSPLGLLVSVVLEPSIDAGALTLTLLLPPINMAGKKEQEFYTEAIKTRSYGILPREGARLTYEVLDLEGVAENVILPFAAEQQS